MSCTQKRLEVEAQPPPPDKAAKKKATAPRRWAVVKFLMEKGVIPVGCALIGAYAATSARSEHAGVTVVGGSTKSTANYELLRRRVETLGTASLMRDGRTFHLVPADNYYALLNEVEILAGMEPTEPEVIPPPPPPHEAAADLDFDLFASSNRE